MSKAKIANLFVLIILFIIGILLRVHAYLINNTFFVDEILLGFNVILKNYISLISPLDYNQSAPFLFLWTTKLITTKFGISELSFRLIPFLSSIGSLFTFYFLSKKILERKWVRLLALLLFCANFALLFYTQAFKPYSSDVLITTVILICVLNIDIKKLSNLNSFLLGILSSVAFCFSFPVVFTVAGATLVISFFTREYKKIIYFLLPNLMTLVIYFLINLCFVKKSPYLNEYWANGFDVFSLNLYKQNYDFLFRFFSHPAFFMFLFAIGLILLFKTERYKALILSSPIIICWIAAALKIYPFDGRLILFLLPNILLILLVPLDKIKFNKNFLNILVIICSSILFINYFIVFSAGLVSGNTSYLRQDVKPLLKILHDEKNEDDILYVYYGSNPSFIYYTMLYNLHNKNIYKGVDLEGNKNPSLAVKYDLMRLPKNKAIWFFFVKGNNQFNSDIKIYTLFLYKKAKVKKDITLKSARLLKVYL